MSGGTPRRGGPSDTKSTDYWATRDLVDLGLTADALRVVEAASLIVKAECSAESRVVRGEVVRSVPQELSNRRRRPSSYHHAARLVVDHLKRRRFVLTDLTFPL